MSRRTVVRLAGLLTLAAAAVLAVMLVPIRDVLRWVDELGPWGPAFLSAFYIVACILMIPGSLVTLAAGALFGPLVGLAAVSVGSTLGASAAFLTGRFIAREWIEKKVAADPRFRAIDQAIAAKGFKIVFLLRLSPVFPFNLLNYGLGLTRVSFRDYFFASWIGMLPGTLLFIYLGHAAKSLDDVFSGNYGRSVWQEVLLWAGLVVTVVVTVFVTRLARRALKDAIPPTETTHG